MKKITDYAAVTDRDIEMGVFVNYIGPGFGSSKVGMIIRERGEYHIQWGNGQQSIPEFSLSMLVNTNKVEVYKF